MNGPRRLAIIVAIAFLAAVVGVLAGRMLFARPTYPGAQMHAFLYEQAHLDDRQRAAIDAIEVRFVARHTALLARRRVENAQLAEAVAAEHRHGPRVTAALAASQRTMNQIQYESFDRVFAIRSLLRPDQAARFDRVVVEALTTAPR